MFELQRSDSQRQAWILESVSSEISLGSQKDFTSTGLSIDPRSTDLEKHSLIIDVDVSDPCQEYQRQTSPSLQ